MSRNKKGRAVSNRTIREAAQKRKAEEREAYLKKNRVKLALLAVAAVAVIVLVWVGLKWFVGPKGSIPNAFGQLRGVEADWLVSNTGTDNKPTYYKLGAFSAPEGFHEDPEFLPPSDEKEQTHYYVADDEGALVQSVYASGVAGIDARAQAEKVATYGLADDPVVNERQIGGQTFQTVFMTYDTTEDGLWYANLYLYADVAQASSVVLMLSSGPLTEDALPEEAAMLEAAEAFVPHLTLVQK